MRLAILEQVDLAESFWNWRGLLMKEDNEVSGTGEIFVNKGK